MTDNTRKLHSLSDDQLICNCSKVNKGEIRRVILSGASSIQDIQAATKAGIGNRCKELNPSGRCCHSDLRILIEIYGKYESGNNAPKCSCCTKQETQK